MPNLQPFLLSLLGALVGGSILLCIAYTLGQVSYTKDSKAQWTSFSQITNSRNLSMLLVNETTESLYDDSFQGTVEPINVQNAHQEQVDYVCYDPTDGLSSPVVTILTELNWPDKNIENFIRTNRLNYAKIQGYRYCELADQMDKNRYLIWSRVPFLLSILPCTEFAVHMDGDAIFFNPEFSFQPWISRMQNQSLDLIMSQDYIPLSPVNFGVFMVRNKAWTYEALRQVYNLCACDHKRIWDWPREQGVVFDWVSLHENDELQASLHAKVIESTGWNAHFLQRDPLSMDNFVVHFAGCCYRDDRTNDQSFDFKYNKMIEYYRQANSNNYTLDVEKDFVVDKSQCRNMVWKRLSHQTDYLKPKHWGSSLLDYDLRKDGQLKQVEVHSVQCVENMECSLLQYWDGEKGQRKKLEDLH